jgi:hypothetical protein
MDKPALLAHFRVNALLRIRFPETSAMWKTPSKLVALAVAALVALPAMAGDFGGNPFPRHHGGSYQGHAGYRAGPLGVRTPRSLVIRHQGPSVIGTSGGWNGRSLRFAGNDGRFHQHFGRGSYIKRISPSSSQDFARNNIVIIDERGVSRAPSGTYAGSSYPYETDGGTYVGGYGYGSYGDRRTVKLAPMAKVISVAQRRNPCSYEQGVCVIRP